MEQEFSEQFQHSVENVITQLYGVMLKEVKRTIKLEGEDYQTGFQQGLAEGKKKVLENFPMWSTGKRLPERDRPLPCRRVGLSYHLSRAVHKGRLEVHPN